MNILVTDTLPDSASCLVHFHEETSSPLDGISSEEFSGKFGSHVILRELGKRVLYVGIGSKPTLDRFRRAAAVAARTLRDLGVKEIVWDLKTQSPSSCHALTSVIEYLVDGVITGPYRFEAFLPESRKSKTVLETLILLVPDAADAAVKDAVDRGHILGKVINQTREWGNSPPNVLYPKTLAEEAQAIAKEHQLRFRVIEGDALEVNGFGGHLAVGGGAVHEPCLIELRYQGAQDPNSPTYAVVGKAVTFDSGGISIKPAAEMDEMKFDKMGGCAALGVIKAVAAMKLPINLVVLIPSAENLLSSMSYRPGDVVTIYGGETVEILNTDAEGRIILADALAYLQDQIKPDLIVDMATLTGACVVALGMHRSGLFSNDESLQTSLVQLGEETGDRVWPMPLGEDYDEDVKSDIATVKNSAGRWGGACTAASFLKTWIGKTPWAHLDIAGTAWYQRPKSWSDKGANGVGVRLLTRFFQKLSQDSAS